jgi:hypothetical protein
MSGIITSFVGGSYGQPPGAPTIGTATVASTTSVSVTFTAPACTGVPPGITGYQVLSTPGCISNTGASSPIVVSGLTTGTAYTFKARASNIVGYGALSAASNSVTPAVIGQDVFTGAGTYSWVAPAGVTSVSAVAVTTGNRGYSFRTCCQYLQVGGVGGALSYKNSISVTPGCSYAVVIGATGAGVGSSFVSTGVLKSAPTGCGTSGSVGDGGGYGGQTVGFRQTGGGGASVGGSGAGGYSGNGGNGGNSSGSTAGSGGGGGGGNTSGGGGVGLLGAGANGCAGGVGGSGGGNASGTTGGAYGGGGGSGPISCAGAPVFTTPGSGAVRIIYPGSSRSFPSTCTGDL